MLVSDVQQNDSKIYSLYIIYIMYICVCVCAQSLQSCLILWNPMDCRLPGSSVHGIFQARILEWVAISYSRGSSWPRDWTHLSFVSELAGRFFTTSTTWSQPRHHKEFLIHLEMQQKAWTLKGMIKMYGCLNTISILPHGMSTISILPGTFSRFKECEWHLSE